MLEAIPEPTSRPYADPDRQAQLTALQAAVRRLEGGELVERGEVLPLGVSAIDDHLPGGGLGLAALHEVRAAPDLGEGPACRAAATGFAALLMARTAEKTGDRVLWLEGGTLPYAPGLEAFGLGPDRLLVMPCRSLKDRLWAAEEAVSSGAFAAVALVGDPGDLTATRRLQLAAERGGRPLIVLGTPSRAAAASVAVTRWLISPEPAVPQTDLAGEPLPGVGDPVWNVVLSRCRAGRPGQWRVCLRNGALREVIEHRAPSRPRPIPQRLRRAA